jgi:hypothetical protein
LAAFEGMREAITPNIRRLDGPTFNLYVKDHSSLILRSDEWSPAELRAIAKDIERKILSAQNPESGGPATRTKDNPAEVV